jgi:hypothetical protein
MKPLISLSLAVIILFANSSVYGQGKFGLYTDTAAETNCMPFSEAEVLDLFFYFKDLDPGMSIEGWVAEFSTTGDLALSLTEIVGDGMNIYTFPKMHIGTTNFADSNGDALFARLQCLVLGPGEIFVTNMSEDIMGWINGPYYVSSGEIAIPSYLYANADSPVFVVGDTGCPEENYFLGGEVKTTVTTLGFIKSLYR